MELCDIYNILCNNRGRLFKGHKFYSSFETQYNKEQTKVEQILDNLYKMSYWKDYLHIIEHSKNPNMNEYIYSLLEKQIKIDIINYNENKPFSSLAKWFPRQGSHFDRNIKFVDIMSQRLFPQTGVPAVGEPSEIGNMVIRKKGQDKDQDRGQVKVKVNMNRLRGMYRKQINALTKRINPIEISMCAKKLDEIDVNKLTSRNISIYSKTLKMPIIRDKIERDLVDRLDNLTYTHFMTLFSQYYKNKTVNPNLLEQVWTNNINKFLLEFDNKMSLVINKPYNLNNRTLIMDIDVQMAKDINYLFNIIIIHLINPNNNPVMINYKKMKSVVYDRGIGLVGLKGLIESKITSYSAFSIDKYEFEDGNKYTIVSNRDLRVGKYRELCEKYDILVMRPNGDRMSYDESCRAILGSPFYYKHEGIEENQHLFTPKPTHLTRIYNKLTNINISKIMKFTRFGKCSKYNKYKISSFFVAMIFCAYLLLFFAAI